MQHYDHLPAKNTPACLRVRANPVEDSTNIPARAIHDSYLETTYSETILVAPSGSRNLALGVSMSALPHPGLYCRPFSGKICDQIDPSSLRLPFYAYKNIDFSLNSAEIELRHWLIYSHPGGATNPCPICSMNAATSIVVRSPYKGPT